MKVRNWQKFQHYKDRNPPWIKLCTDTFQNYDFGRLQDASKLLAVCIWTLAARSKDGEIPNDLEWIKRQCNIGPLVKPEHLKELINQGFIIDDSDMLADCKQNACPEGEAEKRERRGREETDLSVDPMEKNEVDEIFDYWRQELGHPQSKLDAKRRTAIQARLKEGYAVERIKQAIRGIKKCPHNMGQNERQTVYDDIELICRSGTNVDRFAEAEGRKPFDTFKKTVSIAHHFQTNQGEQDET